MLNVTFKLLVLGAWLGSMGWLIRFEAYPHLFDETVQGYRELSRDLPAIRDTWMKVFSNGDHVGYLHSFIEMKDVKGEEELNMTTELVLRIYFNGRKETLRFNNTIRLNARHELLGSESGFFLAGLSGDLFLTPLEKPGEYEMKIEVNDLSFNRTVSIPEEAIISSPFMDQGLRSVKSGQTLRVRAVDPFSMSSELTTIEIRGISSKTTTLPGENQTLKVTRVETHFDDLVVVSDVDQFGRILWQKTPFGLTFRISTADQAVDIPDHHALDPAELFSSPFLQTVLPGAETL